MQKALMMAVCLACATGCATTGSRVPADSRVASAAAPELSCNQTGSRIRLKDDSCPIGPSRVYSREDIERTGAMTLGEALRLLDPAIR
jgi:hypothetical protein